MTDRWLTAGVLTFAAYLNRPTAVALIAAVTVAALQTLHRRRDHTATPWFAMLVAPLGLTGYLLWVGNRMGNLAGYFALQKGAWGHTFDYGKQTADVFSSMAVGRFDYLFAFPFEDTIAAATVLLAALVLPFLIRLRPLNRPDRLHPAHPRPGPGQPTDLRQRVPLSAPVLPPLHPI